MTYIGIDVSKDTFVVAYSSDKKSKTKVFKNTTKGIHEFITTIVYSNILYTFAFVNDIKKWNKAVRSFVVKTVSNV